ncbi:hypothetical protein WJ973_22245 [Achromobacter xylosoxidans]
MAQSRRSAFEHADAHRRGLLLQPRSVRISAGSSKVPLTATPFTRNHTWPRTKGTATRIASMRPSTVAATVFVRLDMRVDGPQRGRPMLESAQHTASPGGHGRGRCFHGFLHQPSN